MLSALSFVIAIGKPSVYRPTTGAVKVEVVRVAGRWELRRGGAPYYVKGAGGTSHLDQLAAAGGNSFRSWGSENASTELAEAQRLGLTMSLGIWLGHKSYFDYGNKAQVAKQYATVEKDILKYKDSPALLVWGLGNEMEAEGNNDTPDVWRAIEDLCKLAKRLDPNHPTMTTVAEVNEQKIRHIKEYAPSLDILGINTYGGIPTLDKRLAEYGWDRPYIITEFGSKGPWESKKTPWGAAIEPTSTEKALTFETNYRNAIEANAGRCLGSYVFYWGFKTEETPTWFGMFLPTSERTGTIDAMAHAWTGKWPAHRCPTVSPIRLEGSEFVAGSRVRAAVDAKALDGGKLVLSWTIRLEGKVKGYAGQGEKAEPELRPEGLKFSDATNQAIEFKMPMIPGQYRLYITVRDAYGNAAVANTPFRVR